MANTERPISFLKDDFKNPSSGVNPASLKDSEFHVRAESFLPERRAGFRLQQKTTATAGTPSCGSCCWHIQEQVLYPVSVGWVGLSDYAWEVCSSSWKSRPFLGATYCDGAASLPYQASSHSLRSPVAGSHGMPSPFTYSSSSPRELQTNIELAMGSSCANSTVCISGVKYVFLFILICFK